jgi:hypothetical protein
MRRESWPDVSVEISRRRWRCVPDAQLCLSQWGAAFVRALTPHAEIWMTPEFLQVLDDWELYDGKPELLADGFGVGYPRDDVREALRLWLGLREQTGARGGRIYWVRDSLRESSLPPGIDDSIVPRYEAMAEALESRLSSANAGSGPIVAARRDAAALIAALPGAFLLTVRDDAGPAPSDGGRRSASRPKNLRAPSICQDLESWGLPCRRVEADDDLVALERNLLQHMLVEAGLSGYLWSGLLLSVVHLVAPGNFRGDPEHNLLGAPNDPAYTEPRVVWGPWENARAFWYDLASGGSHAASK